MKARRRKQRSAPSQKVYIVCRLQIKSLRAVLLTLVQIIKGKRSMASTLEDFILPFPSLVNTCIISHVSSNISFKQLGRLRLVSKTWRSAVETGLFGTRGRFHRQGAQKIVMLLKKRGERSKTTITVALGILEVSTKQLYIHPISSGKDFGDVNLEYPPAAVLAHGTVYVGSKPRTSGPVDWKLYSLNLEEGGEFTTEDFTRDSFPTQNFCPYRLCTWNNQVCLFGDQYVQHGAPDYIQHSIPDGSLVLKYSASSKSWKQLPPFPQDANTCGNFVFFFGHKKQLFVINWKGSYWYPADEGNERSWRRDPDINLHQDILSILGHRDLQEKVDMSAVITEIVSSTSESELAVYFKPVNRDLKYASGFVIRLDLKNTKSKAYDCTSCQVKKPIGIVPVGGDFLLIEDGEGYLEVKI
jgi:hypothetical protein